MGGNGSSPCASCKLLRRRCAKDCVFAPYFPSDDPHKFAIVHKVFGASNVSKILQELPFQQRADAVSSLVYEANARVRDPVYGCVGAISYLQNQVSHLQMQLAVAQAEILCIQMQHQAPLLPLQSPQQPSPFDQINNNTFTNNALHQYYDGDDEEKSCFLENNLSQYYFNNFNFASTSSPSSNGSSIIIHDSLKRENMFGQDMVS